MSQQLAGKAEDSRAFQAEETTCKGLEAGKGAPSEGTPGSMECLGEAGGVRRSWKPLGVLQGALTLSSSQGFKLESDGVRLVF